MLWVSDSWLLYLPKVSCYILRCWFLDAWFKAVQGLIILSVIAIVATLVITLLFICHARASESDKVQLLMTAMTAVVGK